MHYTPRRLLALRRPRRAIQSPHQNQRVSLALLAILLLYSQTMARAVPRQVPIASSAGNVIFVPMASKPPLSSPFGFDLRANIGNDVLPYVQSAKPKWVRAGDALWSKIEPVRGGGYDWASMVVVESNIRRLRQMGIEPTLVIHQTPYWAQRTPGRLCSPPQPKYAADFARFMAALAKRYAAEPLQVKYFEIWNEPDVVPAMVKDEAGYGCWADASLPHHGGEYYGAIVRQVAPAIKASNPGAVILAGALLYNWPDDTVSQSFLRGILVSGAANSFDALSFHAYGEWGAGDLLLAKTQRIRSVLAEYGLANKPLFATEIAAMCYASTTCPTNFRLDQANYAARIYAEAIALNLQGALWYTLTIEGSGFYNSHLVDDVNGVLKPRPAYYAFRNTSRLLVGARYVGPTLREPPPSQSGTVQALTFQKPGSRLYVLWVPTTDFPKLYNLIVPVGARATCTDHLSDAVPAVYDCSDVNRDGMIPRAVNELPQYVEVFQ